ncbi:uncharacterized protein BDW43DRAFT_264547 [Aspergillus alliaceus]|uniref:uncharacterized protein n=1 Tax=Petromyces alliaceus TaxID=209559 RepID=UPI0012A445B4|nr:uncharacterized protein BDW43DRAFT_264547 [Aspergillus alliaceus]KAB8237860.1 hypothetical protein BDW43DRAFT_264547 [Aspergillus alliaceus]
MSDLRPVAHKNGVALFALFHFFFLVRPCTITMFCSKCNIYLEKQPTFLTHRRRPFDALAGLGGVSRLESECWFYLPLEDLLCEI